MISKIKDLMDIGEKLDGISQQVGKVTGDVSSHSDEIKGFRKEVSALRSEIKALTEEQAGFATTIASQLDALNAARKDLEKEVYDFKMIKAEIKSQLVANLSEDFRENLKKEAEKLDTDVRRFNELKQELSHLVGKFGSVQDEIERFKAISSQIKSADFELARHAKELTKADGEKLRLMQKVDHLERLVSKMRRGSR